MALYVIIPQDLATRLHEPLRQYFRQDSTTHVIVERRCRTDAPDEPAIRERSGRRVADSGPRVSRPLVLTARAPELPIEALPYEARLRFVLTVDPTATPDAADPESLRLVSRFQHGDVTAFHELYRQHFDPIYTHIRRALGDPHQAEDVAQDVFVRASEALRRFEMRPGVPLRAWLMKIADREILRVLKKRPAEPRDPREIESMSELAGPDRPNRWLTLPGVDELVDALPARQQQVLILRYAIGLTGAETASAMQTSLDAVDALRRRALETLRHTLTPPAQDPPYSGSRRLAMSERCRVSPVLRRRRVALLGAYVPRFALRR